MKLIVIKDKTTGDVNGIVNADSTSVAKGGCENSIKFSGSNNIFVDKFFAVKAELNHAMKLALAFLKGDAYGTVGGTAFTLVADDAAAETAKSGASVNALIGTSDAGKLYKVKERSAYSLVDQEEEFSDGDTYMKLLSITASVYAFDDLSQLSVITNQRSAGDILLCLENDKLYTVSVTEGVKTATETASVEGGYYKNIPTYTVNNWIYKCSGGLFEMVQSQTYGYAHYDNGGFDLYNDAICTKVDYISSTESADAAWIAEYEAGISNGAKAYFESDNKMKQIAKGDTNTWSDYMYGSFESMFAEHKTGGSVDKVAFAYGNSSTTATHIASVAYSAISGADYIDELTTEESKKAYEKEECNNKYILDISDSVMYKCTSSTEKYLDQETPDDCVMYTYDSKLYYHSASTWTESTMLASEGWTVDSTATGYDANTWYL